MCIVKDWRKSLGGVWINQGRRDDGSTRTTNKKFCDLLSILFYHFELSLPTNLISKECSYFNGGLEAHRDGMAMRCVKEKKASFFQKFLRLKKGDRKHYSFTNAFYVYDLEMCATSRGNHMSYQAGWMKLKFVRGMPHYWYDHHHDRREDEFCSKCLETAKIFENKDAESNPFRSLFYEGQKSKEYLERHIDDENSSYHFRWASCYREERKAEENPVIQMFRAIEKQEIDPIRARYEKQVEFLKSKPEMHFEETVPYSGLFFLDRYFVPGSHRVLLVAHNNSGYDAHFTQMADLINNLDYKAEPIIGTYQKIKQQVFRKRISLGPCRVSINICTNSREGGVVGGGGGGEGGKKKNATKTMVADLVEGEGQEIELYVILQDTMNFSDSKNSLDDLAKMAGVTFDKRKKEFDHSLVVRHGSQSSSNRFLPARRRVNLGYVVHQLTQQLLEIFNMDGQFEKWQMSERKSLFYCWGHNQVFCYPEDVDY